MTKDLEDRIRTDLRRRAEAIHVSVPEPDGLRPLPEHRGRRRLELIAVAAALVLFVGAGVLIALAGRESSPGMTTQVTDEITDETRTWSALCRLDPQPTVAIYMSTDAGPQEIEAVDQYLRETADIDSYTYLDQASTYAEFRDLFADRPEMVASVTQSDFPSSFRVVASGSAVGALTALDLPGIKNVIVLSCSD